MCDNINLLNEEEEISKQLVEEFLDDATIEVLED